MFPNWSLSTKLCKHFSPPALPPSVTPNSTLRTALSEVSVRISTILKTVFRGFTQHVPAESGVYQATIVPRGWAEVDRVTRRE